MSYPEKEISLLLDHNSYLANLFSLLMASGFNKYDWCQFLQLGMNQWLFETMNGYFLKFRAEIHDMIRSCYFSSMLNCCNKFGLSTTRS